MENPSNALAGTNPAAGALDRTSLKAWIMGKSTSASNGGRPPVGPTEHASAGGNLAETSRDKAPMPPGLPGPFTLRIKPDRRRVQIPIDRERRRSR